MHFFFKQRAELAILGGLLLLLGGSVATELLEEWQTRTLRLLLHLFPILETHKKKKRRGK